MSMVVPYDHHQCKYTQIAFIRTCVSQCSPRPDEGDLDKDLDSKLESGSGKLYAVKVLIHLPGDLSTYSVEMRGVSRGTFQLPAFFGGGVLENLRYYYPYSREQ